MPRRILVVDDEPPILFALREYFRAIGYAVDCVGELEEAQALLGGRCYDLVIVDLRLDSFDPAGGLSLIRDVHEQCPASRIILLTAYGSPEVEAEARRRGADVFLHKPMPLPELASIAHALIGEAP